MANQNAPFGFRQVGRLPGAGPNFELSWYKIASANTNAIFTGSVVKPLATGYIDIAGVAAGTILGVSNAFNYFSTAMQRTVYTNFWPGSGATGDVNCAVIVDPSALFQARSTGVVIAFSATDANIEITAEVGSTSTGQSTQGVNPVTLASTSTLPFRIYHVYATGELPGNDPASDYNIIEVTFNNQVFKNLTGLHT